MKKTLLFAFCAFLTPLMLSAQDGNIINGDMEMWTTDTTSIEPDLWNTSASMENGENITRDTDAASGTYSVRMETNVNSANDTVGGYIMLGNVNNGNFQGIPWSDEPSLLHGMFQHDIAAGDTAWVLMFFTSGGIPVSVTTHAITGSQTGWLQLDIPVTPFAFAPDSMWMGITSSNVINEINITPGSWLMADSLWFTGAGAIDPIPNHSFEDWSANTATNLDGDWWSFNTLAAPIGLVPVAQSTDAHSGSFAAQIQTLAFQGDTLEGFLTNSDITANFGGGQPYTAMPTDLEGWIKYFPQGNDSAAVQISFMENGNIIELQQMTWGGIITNYTAFSLPLTLGTQPDSMFIVFYAGENPGSILYVDDVTLSGGDVSIAEQKVASGLKVWPNPANSEFNIAWQLAKNSNVTLRMTDLSGREILSIQKGKQSTGQQTEQLNLSDLPSGIYLLRLEFDGGVLTQKFIRQ